MNQSMGANTLEKSSFGSDWQDESANELWKASYSSSQNVQNTNQVYENLLRICEEIDAALPEIQSTVNKGGLHINEHKFLPENRILQDPFLQSIDDMGTTLEDIEIYQDILNSSTMMWSNENQNFHLQRNFANSLYSEEASSTSDAYFQGQPTQSAFDDRPFFADNEIEQYLMNKRLQHFPNTTVSGGTKEDEDSLQLWRKLNCLASEVQPIHKSEVLDNDEPLDLSMKPAKSVLAILDFTMPSLSSSAPSSPEQRNIDHDTISLNIPEVQYPTPHSTTEPEQHKKCDLGLPVLVDQPETSIFLKKVTKTKKKKKSSKSKTRKLLQQDLVLSSSSDESSLSTIPGSTCHKKLKLDTLPKPVADNKSLLSHLKESIKTKKKHSKCSKGPAINSKSITSPTLQAGAAYIEKQLSMIPDDKPSSTPYEYLPKKHIPEKPTRRRSKEQNDGKKYSTRLSAKPKSIPSNQQNFPLGLPSLSDENNNQK